MRLLIALLLGLCCAFAVACGEDDTGLISPNRAQSLQENLDDLDDAVSKGQCERAGTELQRITEQIDRLPETTDRALRERLREGIENLDAIAPEECSDAQTETQTQTTETQPTETVPTETTPPPTTETTPPPTTETTPPPTTETTPPPETVPPETTPVPPESPPGGEEAPSGAAGDEG